MQGADTQWSLVLRLALHDYFHEKLMSTCYVLALSAVLLPLLILFGLKFGIINNLLAPLKEDPRYRQILPTGSGSYGPDWFAAMAARDDVAFVVPRTRAIAATMQVRRPARDSGRILDVELIPSGPGDPVLDDVSPPAGLDKVVVSLDVADKLGADPGDPLEGIVRRVYRGQAESVRLALRVAGVAPVGAFARDGMFVSGDLLTAVEDFRDGRAVPALGWEGAAATNRPRVFAGFRLFARDITDVSGLRASLMARGIDVRTRLADIELVRALDRNLGIVFWVIAATAAAGYGLAFGTSVWANIERKRRDFGVLRLAGFGTRAIVWFPVVQATLTALIGWAAALVAFLAVQSGLNALFLDNLGGGDAVCRLALWHPLVALLLTLAAATPAAALCGVRLAQMEPSSILRAG